MAAVHNSSVSACNRYGSLPPLGSSNTLISLALPSGGRAEMECCCPIRCTYHLCHVSRCGSHCSCRLRRRSSARGEHLGRLSILYTHTHPRPTHHRVLLQKGEIVSSRSLHSSSVSNIIQLDGPVMCSSATNNTLRVWDYKPNAITALPSYRLSAPCYLIRGCPRFVFAMSSGFVDILSVSVRARAAPVVM